MDCVDTLDGDYDGDPHHCSVLQPAEHVWDPNMSGLLGGDSISYGNDGTDPNAGLISESNPGVTDLLYPDSGQSTQPVDQQATTPDPSQQTTPDQITTS